MLFALGVFGILLPIIQFIGLGGDIPKSISETYYTYMGDWFVGTLFAFGFSIFFYKGFNLLENILSVIAGIAAWGVALLPCQNWSRPYHLTSAIILFGILISFIFLFTKEYSRVGSLFRLVFFITMGVASVWLILMIILKNGQPIYMYETAILFNVGASFILKSNLFRKRHDLPHL